MSALWEEAPMSERVSDEEARKYLGNTGFIEGRAVADLLDARARITELEAVVRAAEAFRAVRIGPSGAKWLDLCDRLDALDKP